MDQCLRNFHHRLGIGVHGANVETDQHVLHVIEPVLGGGEYLGEEVARYLADFVKYFGRDAIE